MIICLYKCTGNVEQFYNAHSNRQVSCLIYMHMAAFVQHILSLPYCLPFDTYLQGIAVLAFEVGPGCLDQIFSRYSKLHPSLLSDEYKEGVKVYDNEAKILEVYAYYQGEKHVSNAADEGTKLRFVEPMDGVSSSKKYKLPGIASVPAEFRSCHPAYFDHWVSNGRRTILQSFV